MPASLRARAGMPLTSTASTLLRLLSPSSASASTSTSTSTSTTATLSLSPRSILLVGAAAVDALALALAAAEQGRESWRAERVSLAAVALEGPPRLRLGLKPREGEGEGDGQRVVVVITSMEVVGALGASAEARSAWEWVEETVRAVNAGALGDVVVVGTWADANMNTNTNVTAKQEGDATDAHAYVERAERLFQAVIRTKAEASEEDKRSVVMDALPSLPLNTPPEEREWVARAVAKATPGWSLRDVHVALDPAALRFSTAELELTVPRGPRAGTSVRIPLPTASSTNQQADQEWAGVAGYDDAKAALRRLVTWRWDRAEQLERYGVPASGVLLHGPSGCGKTLLVNALARASENRCNFLAVKASDVFSQWFGESERLLRETFARARAMRPCLVFLDEFDALAPRRSREEGTGSSHVASRVLATLLNELDGVDSDAKGLVVVGATNRLDAVDEAAMRPGRLGALVEVGMPTVHDRKAILELRSFAFAADVDAFALAASSAGFTCAQVSSWCSLAATRALREGRNRVAMSDFLATKAHVAFVGRVAAAGDDVSSSAASGDEDDEDDDGSL